MGLTTLDKSITRRIGPSRLVVRISREGIELRGYRRRRWRRITWQRIASLLRRDMPLIDQMEEQVGASMLAEIGAATPTAPGSARG